MNMPFPPPCLEEEYDVLSQEHDALKLEYEKLSQRCSVAERQLRELANAIREALCPSSTFGDQQ